jgi:DNA repair protein RadC
MTIKLSESQKVKVLNSEDIYKVMHQILMRAKKIDRDKEHFWIVCLANNNQILLIELISLGTVNKSIVEPMEVFSFALQKRAVKIIMVHNHPSGELVPSNSDITLTDKMLAIGKFINVPIIDHLIITEKSYLSFVDAGLLQKIEAETEYDLTFSQIDALKEELKELEKKKSREIAKKTIDIAKKALKEGLSIEQIINITGLSREQVEVLQKSK